jgi:hypothetical protein
MSRGYKIIMRAGKPEGKLLKLQEEKVEANKIKEEATRIKTIMRDV